MKITLLVLGKTDGGYLDDGILQYLKRLKHYIGFEIRVIPELKNTRNLSIKEQTILEGEQILSQVVRHSDAILLDERGQQPTSKDFAALIQKKMLSGSRELSFIIGGPYGFSDEVKAKISSSISLSRLTFSHQMVRLIFVEQLYRAMTIIKGEPYHHE